MNIWNILVYLLLGLLGIGFIILAFIVWAMAYVSMDDEERERELMREVGSSLTLTQPLTEFCEDSDKEEKT